MPEISQYSIVEKGAELADDVVIGPFCHIGSKVSLGPGCRIENNVTILGRTTLAENNHVHPLSVIGVATDGDKPGKCIFGPKNTIRENCTIYTQKSRTTILGSGNLLMIGSQVGAGATVGDGGIFANFTIIGDEAIIENHVRTSGFTSIRDKVTVGAYTFTAGYADMDHDAPPFAIIQGCPFRVRGVNTVNLRRSGFGEEDVQALKEAFRELFNGQDSSVNRAVLQRILAEPDPNPRVRLLAEAIDRMPAPGDRL